MVTTELRLCKSCSARINGSLTKKPRKAAYKLHPWYESVARDGYTTIITADELVHYQPMS
jgi:hypothetical protein